MPNTEYPKDAQRPNRPQPQQATALTISTQEWPTVVEQAKVALRSGFLPDTIKTPEQALSIVMKGRELGIPMMQALASIVVIKGKPTANAELMAALIFRDHGDDALQFVKSDSEVCTIKYGRRHSSGYETYSYTIKDAQKAGLLSNATWGKYPAAMLRARCISAVARMKFPDSIAGMYTPEELGADVDVNEDGQVVIKDSPDYVDADFEQQEVKAPKKTEKLEELFGEEVPEPTALPLDVPLDKWIVFRDWLGKWLSTKAGCADFLINQLHVALFDEGNKLGTLNDEEWLHIETDRVKGMKKAKDAVDYLALVRERNGVHAQ